MDLDWTASFSIRFRNGTCIIIVDKKYNIANSSCHFRSYGSIWTGPSLKKYYMDLRSFGPYDILLSVFSFWVVPLWFLLYSIWTWLFKISTCITNRRLNYNTLGGKVPRQYFIALQHYYLIGDKVANATVYKYIYLTIIKFLLLGVPWCVKKGLILWTVMEMAWQW
jgi:hypothetical protein